MDPTERSRPPARSNPLRRYAPVLAVGVVVALVAAVLVVRNRGDDDKTGTATVASKLPLTPATAEEQGKQVDFGPDCDPATGRIRVPTVYAPPCVAGATGPGKAGSTTQGVTDDSITIAAYVNKDDILISAVAGSGGGGSSSERRIEEAYRAYIDYFTAHYDTHGRKVNLVIAKASGGGADDAAGKADAIKVATEVKAFASLGGPTQTSAYADELAARKVICLCAYALPESFARERAPFVWGIQQPFEQLSILLADWLDQRVKGGKAEHAGDPALQAKERRFGLISYDTPTGEFRSAADSTVKALKNKGIEVGTQVSYAFDLAKVQETATTLVTKMKDAGVTTLLFVGDPATPIFMTGEATKQGYFPEWVITGTVLTDTTNFGRFYDQKQWAHAFGIGLLPTRLPPQRTDPSHLYEWQFGKQPNAQGTYAIIYTGPFMLFTGLHLAGQKLTPETFRDGLFSYPPTGGGPTAPKVSWGRHGFFPVEDYFGFDDVVELWWDPAAPGVNESNQQGTGMMRYIDGGARHTQGTFADTPTPAFKPEGTVLIYDQPPPQDKRPEYPPPARPS